MLENENIKAAIFAVLFLAVFSYLGHHNKQCGTNIVVNTTAPNHEQEDIESDKYETIEEVEEELYLTTSTALLEAERIAGFNFRISGACRTKKQNKKIGGAKFSTHIRDDTGKCNAVDIAFLSISERDKIVNALKKTGFVRIAPYSNHIHVDNRVNPKIYKQASWKGGKSK